MTMAFVAPFADECRIEWSGCAAHCLKDRPMTVKSTLAKLTLAGFGFLGPFCAWASGTVMLTAVTGPPALESSAPGQPCCSTDDSSPGDPPSGAGGAADAQQSAGQDAAAVEPESGLMRILDAVVGFGAAAFSR
jgi:hypothetical protein